MDKMTKEDLLRLFDEFICDNGLVLSFNEFLDGKGYSEKEYDEAMESTRQ